MAADAEGPPYLWLGRGWGWTSDDFSHATATGFSITAFGAAVGGIADGSANNKVFNVGSGEQVVCFGAAPDASQTFDGGILCLQEPSLNPQPASGGSVTAFGPAADSVTISDFLEFRGTADGEGDIKVHELAVTNFQACAVYSTDSVSRAMKCWGSGAFLPEVQQNSKQSVIDGSAVAQQAPFLPPLEDGETCSGGTDALENTDNNGIRVVAIIDITYASPSQQQTQRPSDGDQLAIPARPELTAAGGSSDGSVPVAEIDVTTEACGVTVRDSSVRVLPSDPTDDREVLIVTDSGDVRASAAALDFESFPEGGYGFSLEVTVEFSDGSEQVLTFPGTYKITDVNEAPAPVSSSAAGMVTTVSAPVDADADAITIADAAAPAFTDPESGTDVVYYILGKDVDHPQIPSPTAPGVAGLSVDRTSGAVTFDAASVEYTTGDDGEFDVRLVACDGELTQLSSGKFAFNTPGVLCAVGSPSLSSAVRFSCAPGSSETATKQCESCPPGRFSSQGGALVCSACPPAAFAGESGSMSCEACPTGTLIHEEGGQSESCLDCSGADENAEANDDRSACVCAAGYEAVGDSGDGRGESIECAAVAELELGFGSAERLVAQDDQPLSRGFNTGVSVVVRGGGGDVQLAMVFDGSTSPSAANSPYGGKAMINIKEGLVPPPVGSSVTEGEDGTDVTDTTRAGGSGVVVKPLAGSIRAGDSDVTVSLEVSLPESDADDRSINFEDVPEDSRDFSFRIVVRSGACSAGSELSQACKDSMQSAGPLSFRAIDLVDPPQLAIAASTAVMFEQSSGQASYLRLVDDGQPLVEVARRDGQQIAPTPEIQAQTGRALITFASEDESQPDVTVSAEVRLPDGSASTDVDLQLVSSLFSFETVPRTVGGAGLLSLPSLEQPFLFGDSVKENLRCGASCPSGLELVITAKSAGQRANGVSPQLVLPLTVEGRNEPPRFNRAVGQISMPEDAKPTDEPTAAERAYLRVAEPDAGDAVVSCSSSNELFAAVLQPSDSADADELTAPGRSVVLRVAAGQQLDYETQTSHTTDVQCTDSTGMASSAIRITVNVNDVLENRPPFAPTVIGQDVINFFENPEAGTRLQGTLSVGDPDETDLEDLTVTVLACDDGTDENGLPLCSLGGESGLDLSPCVSAVEVTSDPYDAYNPDTSVQRLFALEVDPSGAGCAQLLDFETEFSGSFQLANKRFVKVVVEDNQPAARRLAALGGNAEKHASFRRRLLASTTTLEVEIQNVDEQVVVNADIANPTVIEVDENDVPIIPVVVTDLDRLFTDPDGFSDQLRMRFSFNFMPQPGQTASDEPTEQIVWDDFTGVVEQRGGFDFESSAGNVFVYEYVAEDPDVDEGQFGPQPAKVTFRFEVQDVNERPDRQFSTISLLLDEQSTNLRSSLGLDMSQRFSDVDAGDSLTFSLKPRSPSTPLPIAISPAGLITLTSGPIVFEDHTPVFGSIASVVATDSGGLTRSTSLFFTVINKEFEPEFTSGDIEAEIEENVAGPVALGSLAARDRDASDTVSFQVVADDAAVAARFSVTGSAASGFELSYVGSGEDYEALVANGGSNSFEVRVLALDGKVSAADADSVSVTLTITDVEEAPVVLSAPSLNDPPPVVRKDADAGSSIVGAAIAFQHSDPVEVTCVLTCHCVHLRVGGSGDVGDDGACKADACLPSTGLEFSVTPGADGEASTAQLQLADASAFEGAAASYQVEAVLVSGDGSESETVRFRIAVLCPEAACPAGSVPLGTCGADQPQRCVPISGAANTDDYDFSIGPDAETRDGFENGKLTLMQTAGRARGDSCESTLRVGWFDGDRPAWYRELIEPYREFRVLGLDNEFQADVVLAQGQQGFLEVLQINGGNQAVTGLSYRLGDAAETDDFTRVGGTSTVGTRCFCAPCGSESEYKNPVCKVDDYAAQALSQSDWCLECTRCRSGQEYETKSCRGSHEDETADVFQNRECAACTECGYDQYAVGGCSGREDRECADRMVEGYPRPYRSEGNSGPFMEGSFSNGMKNEQCMAQVRFVWSTRDRSENGGDGWFMIKETRHRNVQFSYVFHATDGEELQIVLGKQVKNDQRYQLYRYGRSSSTEQPAERPSSSDEQWHSIGRSVDIGQNCVETPEPANVISVEETSRRTGSNGRLEYAIDENQRDEDCHVIVRVSYAGDEAEMAPSATFLLRETRHRSVPFTREVTVQLGTTVLVDLGDRSAFNGKTDVRITLFRSDGRGGWIQSCRSLDIGNRCLTSPEEAPRSSLQPVDLRWDQVTRQPGRLYALYGTRRSAEGRAVMRVAYYDPDGPDVTVLRVRETRHRSVNRERQVTLRNGFSAVIDMGAREDLGRKSDVRFGLFYESLWNGRRGRWIQRQSIDLGSRDLETFQEAPVVSAEFPRSTVQRTWSRGTMTAVYGNRRSPSCDLVVRVAFNDPSGCEGEQRTFVLRETRHRSVNRAFQVTLTNGQETLVNLGSQADFKGKTDVRISLQYFDSRTADWRTSRSLDFGRHCVNEYLDPEDQAATIESENRGYDSWSSWTGRLDAIWNDDRAPANTGWVDSAGRAVEECDVAVRVSYYDRFGPSSKRFLISETRHNSVNFNRIVTLENGQSTVAALGPRSAFNGKSDIRLALSTYSTREGTWVRSRNQEISIGNNCVQTYENARTVQGYPVANYAPTRTNSALVDFETVIGDTNRLADGSIALTLRYCSDTRFDPEAVTVVLKETRHRSVGWAVQVRLERCTETIAIVGSSELGNKHDVRISAYLLESDGDLRFIASRNFGRARLPVTEADLVPAASGASSSGASATSVRGGVSAQGSSVSMGVSSKFAAETGGIMTVLEVSAAGGVSASVATPEEAASAQLTAIVQDAGVDAQVFVNAGSEEGAPASIVIVPASQREAAEAALEAASAAGTTASVHLTDRLTLGEGAEEAEGEETEGEEEDAAPTAGESDAGADSAAPGAVSPVIIGAVAVAGVALVGMAVAIAVAARLRAALNQQNKVNPGPVGGGSLGKTAASRGTGDSMPTVGDGVDVEIDSDADAAGSSGSDSDEAPADPETGRGAARSTMGASSPRVVPRMHVSVADGRTPSRVDLLGPRSPSGLFTSAMPLGSSPRT